MEGEFTMSKQNLKITPINPNMITVSIGANPMWETKQNMEPYLSENSMDAQRISKYQDAKKVLDDYARCVIDVATQSIVDQHMTPTYEKMEELFNKAEDKTSRQKYFKAVEDFKKCAAGMIKKVADEYQLTKEFGKLFNAEKSAVYKNAARFGLNAETLDILSVYNGFTSYFNKYFASLSSTILCGTEHGSVAKRIAENMEYYWKNAQLIREIREDHPDLYAAIQDKVNGMNVEMCITQKGIDTYNMILGNMQNTGLNSIISEYAQKERTRIRLLKQLNKIPLAKVEKQVVIESIETDEELRHVVAGSLPVIENILGFAKRCVALHFDAEMKESTYLVDKNLNTLSNSMYGRYDMLRNALAQIELSQKEKEENIYSLASIDKAMAFIETEAHCSYVDVFKEYMTEALKAENRIETVRQLCNDVDLKSKRRQIKDFYDCILYVRKAAFLFYRAEIENTFVEDVAGITDDLSTFNSIYNKVRNYCTQNPVKKDSRDIFFNKGTFLNSFDSDKFKDGTSVSTLLHKDGMYYLYVLNPAVSTKLSSTAYVSEGGYDRLVYKQLSGLNKMFPKCFVSSKDAYERYGLTEEIRDIVAEKRYTKEAADREACVAWIRYCIESFKKNEVWTKYYNVDFKAPEEYESANDFYTQTERHTIYMGWTEHLSEDYIRKSVEDGSAFLFQLYNKDFSPYHHGKDSKYTRILKELFSEENLRKLNETDETALKLASGGASLVFRKASIPYRITHEANEELKNKNPLNPKKTSTFSYGISKDRRFMFDKFILRIGVQLGFRNQEVLNRDLNRLINEQIIEKKPNVLTVRVGEEHLLYYMVSDNKGNILDQGDLNIIESHAESFAVKTDYKEILKKREQEMIEAKESWDYSVDIKDVKNGYVSNAIRTVLDIRDKYDAVILLEDFNGDFISKRHANVKAVYQQFQSGLLAKLSCYVQEGHPYSEAVQLATPASSLDDLKGQHGIVFFVNASYTSNVDPTSGFCNQFYEMFTYRNKKKADAVCEELDVTFDHKDKEFLVTIKDDAAKEWVLHTRGQRSMFKDKKLSCFDCNAELADLMHDYGITDFRNEYKAVADKTFYERFFEIMRVLLQMHYSSMDDGDRYFVSPVTRYDTRKKSVGEPVNSSSVKTYLLLKKGIRDLNSINEETLMIERDARGKHKENWLAYLQAG